MRKIQLDPVRKAVFLIPLWQLVVSVVLALLVWAGFDGSVATGLLVGGGVSALGSLVFALSVFAAPTTNSRVVLRRMFRGEALKMALVAVLFYLAITVLRVKALPTMVGFVATLVVFWVALLRSLTVR